MIPDAPSRPAYQERVLAEKADLDEKRHKLEAFMKTETFTGLPEADRDLLQQQAAAMDLYASILDKRIQLFTA